jgi:hypothetical protein
MGRQGVTGLVLAIKGERGYVIGVWAENHRIVAMSVIWRGLVAGKGIQASVPSSVGVGSPFVKIIGVWAFIKIRLLETL